VSELCCFSDCFRLPCLSIGKGKKPAAQGLNQASGLADFKLMFVYYDGGTVPKYMIMHVYIVPFDCWVDVSFACSNAQGCSMTQI
jgi:hypothetical protein